MEFNEKRYSIESGLAKGRPVPDWVLKEPDLFPGDEFYIKAFWELSTCRDVGMSLGPIPWRDIIHYAMVKGLEEDLVDPFVQIVREMDSGYLQLQQQKQEKDKG